MRNEKLNAEPDKLESIRKRFSGTKEQVTLSLNDSTMKEKMTRKLNQTIFGKDSDGLIFTSRRSGQCNENMLTPAALMRKTENSIFVPGVGADV